MPGTFFLWIWGYLLKNVEIAFCFKQKKFLLKNHAFSPLLSFSPKPQKVLFIKFAKPPKQKPKKMIKTLKNRGYNAKSGNKMTIDLALLFIYNYYGEVSGENFPENRRKICAKAKIYI